MYPPQETTMMTKTPPRATVKYVQGITLSTGNKTNALPMTLHAPNATGETTGKFAVDP